MTVSLKHVSIQTSIGTVEGFFDAYRRLDIDEMMRYCNPKGRIRIVPLREEGEGEIQTAGRKLWSGMMERFPDLTNTVDFVFSDLDGHVCAEVVMSGAKCKDGEHFEVSHAFIFEVSEDGRIQKIRDYWDNSTE